MNKIKNITGTDTKGRDGRVYFKPQDLAYNEVGKGNLAEKIKKEKFRSYVPAYSSNLEKFKDYVLIEAGEEIETELNGENIGSEPRLILIKEGD